MALNLNPSFVEHQTKDVVDLLQQSTKEWVIQWRCHFDKYFHLKEYMFLYINVQNSLGRLYDLFIIRFLKKKNLIVNICMIIEPAYHIYAIQWHLFNYLHMLFKTLPNWLTVSQFWDNTISVTILQVSYHVITKILSQTKFT